MGWLGIRRDGESSRICRNRGMILRGVRHLNPFYKNLALWLVITLMMIMLYNLFNQQQMPETSISYTQFLTMVDSEKVERVTIQGQELLVTDSDQNRFKVFAHFLLFLKSPY